MPGPTLTYNNPAMPTVYAEFDQESLDLEYSPSSRIEDINVYLDEYVRASEEARNRALQAGSCEPDLRYGPSEEETLDLFVPDGPGPSPLHVFIHGGYWQLLSKNESCFAAPVFQQLGSAFAALNYTLAPHQSLTGIVEEVRRAIAWLYRKADQWNLDRDRIFISGHSAGAHLAMMLLLTDWAKIGIPSNIVKGVCAVSGIFDLEPVRLTYVNEKVGMDADEAHRNSPILHGLSNHCPVIFAYGDNETQEFKRQSDEYAAKLRAESVSVTVAEIKDRNHFDVILDLADPDTVLANNVFRQMRLA